MKNKIDFIKIENSSSSKHTKKVNKWATGWEKIFAKYTYLTKSLYLEYIKNSFHENKNNTIRKKKDERLK